MSSQNFLDNLNGSEINPVQQQQKLDEFSYTLQLQEQEWPGFKEMLQKSMNIQTSTISTIQNQSQIKKLNQTINKTEQHSQIYNRAQLKQDYLKIIQLLNQQDPDLQILLKCIKNNELNLFCVNKSCKYPNSFVCQNPFCKCNEDDQQCFKIQIKLALKKLNKKLKEKKISSQNQRELLKSKFLKIFQIMISNINSLLDNIFKRIDQKFIPSQSLTELQKKFLKAVKGTNSRLLQQFNGNLLATLWQNISINKNSFNPQQQCFIKRLQIFEFDCLKDLYKKSDQFLKSINNFEFRKKSNQPIILQKPSNQIQNITRPIFSFQKLHSSIVKSTQQRQQLRLFFPPAFKVKNFKVIFKASQHNFQMKKFYDLCGDKSSLIIICQTTMNKIIGGFTPYCLNPFQNGGWQVLSQTTDHNQQYFIIYHQPIFLFSLTNNDKFILKNPDKKIRRFKQKNAISFGYKSLFINNKANQHNQNYSLLDGNYKNQKYTDHQQSYLQFNGNKMSNFRIKEWEAIQVFFKS